MRLSDLVRNERALALEFAGDTLNFSYRPGLVTPAFSDALGTEKRPLIWALSRVVVSWDLVDDAGQPLPLTEQSLTEIPTPFLRSVLHAILDDVNVGEAFGSNSKTG